MASDDPSTRGQRVGAPSECHLPLWPLSDRCHFEWCFLPCLPVSLLSPSSNRLLKVQGCDCGQSRASWPSSCSNDEVSLKEFFTFLFLAFFFPLWLMVADSNTICGRETTAWLQFHLWSGVSKQGAGGYGDRGQ